MTVNMCSISDRAHWKFYLLLTDGRMLPTITQHMAKICSFLESKAGIFSSYLPASDINLAMREQKRKKKNNKHLLLRVLTVFENTVLFAFD